MKNIKMVINFNVDENTNDLDLMNKVSQLLSQNKENFNADFNLTNNDVYNMSEINTIDEAIKYRESIINSYVKKESFLDKFNNVCKANIKPFFENLKEDLSEYVKLQKEDVKNHLLFLGAVIKNTMENGVSNSEYYSLKRDFYDAQKSLYNEYKLYKDTNNINRQVDKEIKNANSAAQKQAKFMMNNISKNVADVVEIPNNENGRYIYNLLLNEVNNQKNNFSHGMINFYADGIPYAINGQVNSIEDLGNIYNIKNLRIEINHDDFYEVYNKIFKNFDNSNNTLNNIKNALLEANINNVEKINQSVKVIDINNLGTEKAAIINSEIEQTLTKKSEKNMVVDEQQRQLFKDAFKSNLASVNTIKNNYINKGVQNINQENRNHHNINKNKFER